MLWQEWRLILAAEIVCSSVWIQPVDGVLIYFHYAHQAEAHPCELFATKRGLTIKNSDMKDAKK